MGPTSDRDREADLGTIKGFGENLGAGFIDLVIGVERARENSLDIGAVRRMIDAVGGNVGELTSVSKFSVKGREHEDDPLEVIDLFQNREQYRTRLEIADQTRRVPLETRWQTLHEIRDDFVADAIDGP